LPATLWNLIPSGSQIFWRVRGADLAVTPLKVINSAEIWSFFVYDTYPVTDEAHSINDGIDLYLDHASIAIETVVITDSLGSITYESGVDYLLIPEGNQVRVERISGGAISDGQNILVDYYYFDI